MHISYDLPRVIADEWPGQGRWNAGPSEELGEDVYNGMRDLFPSVLSTVAKNPNAMGKLPLLPWLPSWLLGFVLKDKALATASSHWMLELLRAAWGHAWRLHISGSRRPVLEAKIMEAMVKALQEVAGKPVWSVTLFGPPDKAFLHSAILTPGIQISSDTVAVAEKAVFTLLSVAALIWWRTRSQQNQILIFINELGNAIYQNVTNAISDDTDQEFKSNQLEIE